MKQQFIKGAWYKWDGKFINKNEGDGFFCYAKLISISYSTCRYSERINTNGKHVYMNNTCDLYGLILVPNSEIQQYLPPGHPDLQQNALNFLEIW